jgi:hypothetical protein
MACYDGQYALINPADIYALTSKDWLAIDSNNNLFMVKIGMKLACAKR